MSLIDRLIAGRYQVCAKIGEGGMANVYRARDIRTDHQVALKVLKPEYSNDPEFLNRFEREAVAASKVEHHNIVNLLDVGVDGGIRYLVMEYVCGKTLKETIVEKGSLSVETSAQIALRILGALQHAHSNGIIHRDIKPQNILVHDEGMIKVADFGIARIAGSLTLSDGGTILGSVHYFSPEQANGSTASITSDLYSVGIVLYEMLTGHVPFDAEEPVAIAMMHVHTQPPPMSDFMQGISPAMEYVVSKALRKKKDERYQSATDMAKDLCRAIDDPWGSWLPREAIPLKPSDDASSQKQPRVKQKKHRDRRKIAGHIGIAALTLFVLGILFAGGYMLYDRIANTTEVPYVVGDDEAHAILLCDRAGLDYVISYSNHATIPKGEVISQMPEALASVRKGETQLLITVSKGPQITAAPNLLGKLISDVNAQLQSMNLKTFEDSRVVSGEPIGTIVAQTPLEGGEIPMDKTIHVTVSGGLVIVPNVTGKLLSEGAALLVGAKLQTGNIIYKRADSAFESDLIVGQSIESGTSVIEQTRVSLLVKTMDTPSHSGTMALSLPDVTGDQVLRVTVLEADGREFVRYEGRAVSTVSLQSRSPGILDCCVYIDGTFLYKGSAQFE